MPSSSSTLPPRRKQIRKDPPQNPQPPAKGCFKSNTKSKSVWFDYIQIQEYPMLLGDNPSPFDGVPITIGWKSQGSVKFYDVEEYEIMRNDEYNEAPRRSGEEELTIPTARRIKLAILGGSSLTNIGRTAVDVAYIQKHRAQASQKGHLELLKEGFDRSAGLLSPNRKKKPTLNFSRVPNEAPMVLSNWKANAGRIFANAAA